MNIFELFGVIAINNDGANKAIDGTASKANGLAQVFSSMGSAAVKVGKTVATGLAAGAAGIAALTTASVKNYAEYEQLKGGIDTLFGESSATVMEYAQNAYKTAGLSANEYMSTVTGFSSSLLQSLGGDTDAAAKVANMALTDMADNANKMGTSMSLIQNAYQGFAKQNYTMLDNLKLGYGGTEKEMKRLLKDAQKISGVKYNIKNLDDVYEAIHVIQNEMGITGTTAAEASETISGSFASAKSAWDNLLVGMADGEQNIDKLLDTFVDSIKVAIGNVTKLLPTLVSSFSKLVQGIIPEIPAILESVLPSLIEGAVGLIAGLASALPGIAQVLISQIPLIFQQIISACQEVFPTLIQAFKDLFASIDFAALGEAIGNAFKTLVSNIPQLLTDVGNAIDYAWTTIVWPMIQGLFKALFDVELPDWETIKTSISDGWNNTVWPAIQNFFSTVFGIELPDWNTLLTTISEGWNNTVLPGIKSFFTALFNIELPDWETIKTSISEGWNNTVMPGIFGLFGVLFNVVLPNWETITTSISEGWSNTVWPAIQSFFSVQFGIELPDWDTITAAIDGFKTSTIDPLVTKWGEVTTAVGNAFNTAQTWLEDNFSEPLAKFKANVTDKVSEHWNNAKETTDTAFNTAKTWLQNNFADPLSKFKTNVTDKIAAEWSGTVSNAISGAADWVSSFMGIDLAAGWDKITNAVSNAWDTVVGKINSAITALKEFLGLDSGGHNEGRKFGNPFTGNASTNGDALDPTLQHAEGAVFSKPTLFDSRLGRHLVGEAGPEAVAPIGVLQGYVSEAVAKQNAMLVSALDNIHEALLDMDANMGGHMREALNNTSLKINEREFGRLVRTVG